MSVCIDLVLNHTAKEHEWAQKARAGDGRYRDYYFMFPDDMLPKAYESTLVEIFPANAPGNFTYYDDMDRWVWTTFNEHQWDLNWSNPQVFLEMVRVMLFLANKGVDVLRLDAPAFLWKRMGTRCQSEPEVHVLLHALRAATRIAAPARDPPRRGDRRPGRDDALSRPRRTCRQGGQPRLPQLADGAVLVGAGRARHRADEPRDAHAFPAVADQRDLCHLPALP